MDTLVSKLRYLDLQAHAAIRARVSMGNSDIDKQNSSRPAARVYSSISSQSDRPERPLQFKAVAKRSMAYAAVARNIPISTHRDQEDRSPAAGRLSKPLAKKVWKLLQAFEGDAGLRP
jgi:hypothetical protein